MGIKSSQQYLESLKNQKPNVYIMGEKVEDVVKSKYFDITLKEMCKWYDWASDPDKKEAFAYWSPLINEEVSFWTHLRQDTDELRKMIEVMKKYNARHFCSMCMVIGLSVMWATTYDIDQEKGTNYHERLKNFSCIFKKKIYDTVSV